MKSKNRSWWWCVWRNFVSRPHHFTVAVNKLRSSSRWVYWRFVFQPPWISRWSTCQRSWPKKWKTHSDSRRRSVLCSLKLLTSRPVAKWWEEHANTHRQATFYTVIDFNFSLFLQLTRENEDLNHSLNSSREGNLNLKLEASCCDTSCITDLRYLCVSSKWMRETHLWDISLKCQTICFKTSIFLWALRW